MFSFRCNNAALKVLFLLIFLTNIDYVFIGNPLEMRLLNLRINSFIYCGLLVLILVGFFVVSSLCFGQTSTLAFFRWLTATSDRNAESCNFIPSNYCLPQIKKSHLKRILRLRSLISKGFPIKTITNSVPTRLWKTR